VLRPERSELSWLSGLPVVVRHADLTDRFALEPLVAHADYVVHVAGITKAVRDRDFMTGNVETTRAILKAVGSSRSLRKFCLISSLSAAGPSPTPEPIDESAPPRPITPYGESKLEAERVCHALSGEIPIAIIRPPAVYGPRDRDIFHLFRWVSFGVYPHTGPRDKELSVVHARDLARAIYQVTVNEGSSGETYFVADEKPYRLEAVADLVASVMGKRAAHLRIPRWVAASISAVSQLVVHPLGIPAVLSFDKVKDLYELRWTCNAGKIRRQVGYRSEFSLEEGVRDTIDWYRKNKWL